MKAETAKRIGELLDRQTSVSAALRGRRAERCPACGHLVIKGRMAEHARGYGDDAHAVVEVMES